MSAADALPAALGVSEAWEERYGSRWLAPPALDVRAMAGTLLARGARFVTITAQIEEGGDLRVDYHWDLEGELLTFTVKPPEKRLTSICDLCEAADWIEREIHEYFAVELDGRPHEPLFLRAGVAPGVNLREDD